MEREKWVVRHWLAVLFELLPCVAEGEPMELLLGTATRAGASCENLAQRIRAGPLSTASITSTARFDPRPPPSAQIACMPDAGADVGATATHYPSTREAVMQAWLLLRWTGSRRGAPPVARADVCERNRSSETGGCRPDRDASNVAEAGAGSAISAREMRSWRETSRVPSHRRQTAHPRATRECRKACR